MDIKKIYLPDYINSLQQQGRYTFTKKEALKELNCEDINLIQYINRLIHKKRIMMPRKGFLVIIPIEYQLSGEIPASWYIDELMVFEGAPYYAGLLTAAALHGASHQKVQEFQVVSPQQFRSIHVGNSIIHFFKKTNFLSTQIDNVKTPTGYIKVSSPALTAFDLVKYQYACGYLNNVVTVLSELGEKINKKSLGVMLNEMNDTPTFQRLGYLFQLMEHTSLSNTILQWLKIKKTQRIPLLTHSTFKKSQLNKEWNLFINEKVEIDL